MLLVCSHMLLLQVSIALTCRIAHFSLNSLFHISFTIFSYASSSTLHSCEPVSQTAGGQSFELERSLELVLSKSHIFGLSCEKILRGEKLGGQMFRYALNKKYRIIFGIFPSVPLFWEPLSPVEILWVIQ